MSRPTFLYRFFDQNHQLLYVGITYRIESRFGQHRQEKPWDQIATVTVEHHPTREQALEAERAAIQSEKPKWNVVHNTTTSRERPMASSEQPDDQNGLVGHAFHIMKTHDDGCAVVDQQGHIVGQITDDVYLVEFFGWWDGESTHREVIRLEDMAGWRLYDSIAWMKFEWEHGGQKARLDRHLEQCEAESEPAKGEAA